MAVYTERVQTVLTKEQYDLLIQLAAKKEKPVSILLREAVELVYFENIERERRRQALRNILSLNAPVADWPQMEAEIIDGATG